MTEPYIVLIGDVGTGKSTLVEMLSGETGHSSNSKESFTKQTKMFYTKDGRLLVADTPGSNAMKDQLEHNLQIAVALNYRPVSKIFIVSKADKRRDATVDNVRKFATQLSEIDTDILGVIVTHMDKVSWTPREFNSAIGRKLGMDSVVYAAKNRSSNKLQQDILAVCNQMYDLTIDSESFFRLFNIHNYNLKIIKSTKKQVELFKAIKRAFDEQRKNFPSSEEADLLFEFQAWMTGMITTAQEKVARENNFTFRGKNAANEAGHIANMTNQLRIVLYDIRIETINSGAADHGITELRKCPHCGLVWAKIVGCDGETTCGENVGEFDSKNNGVMATYTFLPRISNKLDNFNIVKSGVRQAQSRSSSNYNVGCGKSITWNNMAKVPVPPEFHESPAVTTTDVAVVPKSARPVKQWIGNYLTNAVRNIQFGNSKRN